LARRDDDLPAAILKRLETYRIDVKPVLAFYRSTGRLTGIDGTASPEMVYKALKKAIQSL
jgi:adenylate kinase family enzyme